MYSPRHKKMNKLNAKIDYIFVDIFKTIWHDKHSNKKLLISRRSCCNLADPLCPKVNR